MDIPFTKEELRAATHETIVRNGFKSCYIRPLVFRGAGPMGLYPLDSPVEVDDRRAGSGAPTSATRASSAACAARSPRGAASRPTP